MIKKLFSYNFLKEDSQVKMILMKRLSDLVLGNLERFFYWYYNSVELSFINLHIFAWQVGTEGDQISLHSDHLLYSHHCCGLPRISQLQVS